MRDMRHAQVARTWLAGLPVALALVITLLSHVVITCNPFYFSTAERVCNTRRAYIIHRALVNFQNLLYSVLARDAVEIPPRRGTHCSDLPNVFLLPDVMAQQAFEVVQASLPRVAARDGLCYATPGRRSCVLTAAETAAAAPAVRALHHDSLWAQRLSDTIGVAVYPLDESRFRMAYSTHLYSTGSYNAPHRDSFRTDSKIWTVIYAVNNNSTSHLIVQDVECQLPDNAALAFEGSEHLHWVPELLHSSTGSEVQRTIIFLEYTVFLPDQVRWSWPWSKTLSWWERILFQ